MASRSRCAAQVPLLILSAVGAAAPLHAQCADAGWINISVPSWRTGPAAACDERRGILVVFGGSAGHVLNDTLEWDGERWTPRSLMGPQQRWGAVMAYDRQRQHLVLFGGSDGLQALGDTWAWDGFAWVQQVSAGPPGRAGHALAYDELRHLTVLFGGRPHSGPAFADTWEWDGQAWAQRLVPGPSPRFGHAMTFDSTREVVLLHGGQGTGGPLGDTWEWDGAAWMQRQPVGPTARADHALAYDRARGRAVLFGGSSGNLRDTWEWNGQEWQVRALEGPRLRTPRLFYSPEQGSTMLTSGSDIWRWDGGAWQAHTAPAEPSVGWAVSMAHDSARQATVLLSGYSAVAGYIPGTWERSNSAWQLRTSGGPAPRSGAAMSYDQQRGVSVLFGGYNGASLGDTWEWDGAQWLQRLGPGPSPRSGAGSAFDSARGRTVIYGGYANDYLGSTWEWDGAAWVQPPVSGPGGLWFPAMAFDRGRGVTVLFGGLAPWFGEPTGTRQTWEWDGSTWSLRATGGPPRRGGASMAYDLERARIVLFGGEMEFDGTPLNDTWVWDGVSWTELSLPFTGPNCYEGMAYDGQTGGILRVGGYWSFGGTWLLPSSNLPRTLHGPHDRSIEQGLPVGFAVLAGGGQPLSYRWRRNGVELSDGPQPTGSIISGALTALLSIGNGQPADGGSFDCIISNSCGSTTSPPAALAVRAACYPNCDNSTVPPILNVADFGCFLQRFASGDPYANCDDSTTPPVLNVADFGCFLQAFAAGCPR